MNRTVLAVLAGVVVVAAAAAGATIVLTGDRDREAISTSAPPATAEVTSASPTPTPTITASGGAGSPPPASPAPSPSASAAASGSASTVKCEREPRFCSAKDGNGVADGKLARETNGNDPSYEGVPSIDITSESRKNDGTKAAIGQQVGSIHVEVVVRNDTDRTYVFDKREVVLDIFRNGERYDRLVTTGPGFEMTPGGRMTAQFDRPIVEDGTYSWQAKVRYHAK